MADMETDQEVYLDKSCFQYMSGPRPMTREQIERALAQASTGLTTGAQIMFIEAVGCGASNRDIHLGLSAEDSAVMLRVLVGVLQEKLNAT
jgi:hypothetical protein